MNFKLVIVNAKTNALFSKIYNNTPKMFNKLKEIAESYNHTFNDVFKVRRAIITSKGLKLV